MNAKMKACEMEMQHYECSAKDRSHVEEVFNELAIKVYESLKKRCLQQSLTKFRNSSGLSDNFAIGGAKKRKRNKKDSSCTCK
mmetsp:Transcript_41463/g.47752  ORF Transcript_41463/g.47752 Transcript_41463/m.47752 type:complete len:83 (-) Transcript_41463:25-273(-)